jgi:CelD/BcsL family acetyltransferase involved in cellulose biosynthesis
MHWRIYSVMEFSRHVSAWDRLNCEMQDLPFLHSDFLLPAIAEFSSGDERLAIAEEQGAPVAMGLFRRVRQGLWETFQPSQLPLGAFVSRRGLPLDEALRDLGRSLPGLVLGVALTQQDPALTARPLATQTLGTLDYVDTACVRVAGTFDAYWAGRGKNLRQNIKKQLAKLGQDGAKATLDVIERPEEVREAIAQYGMLETAGWKATRGTAISPDNAQGHFYRAVFEKSCSKGSGRIYRYSLDGRVVAMDLCLIGGGALVILKTTYDESLKSISPAFLMRYCYMPAVFAEERINRIEFYGKVMEWHLRWTNDVRTLFHVNRYRWHWVKAMREKAAGARDAPTVADNDAANGPADRDPAT